MDDPAELARPKGAISKAMLDRFEAANALARQGRMTDAVQAYRSLLRAHPGFLEAAANLGSALSALRRFGEAESCFLKVSGARPDAVPVLLGLAYAVQHQTRPGEAEQHYRHVLSLEPDCVKAMLGAGVCLRAQSKLEQAGSMFEHAVRTDPDCVDAWYLLSTLRRLRAEPSLLAHFATLQSRVTGMSVKRQARYWFALGSMYEAAARFDEAFAAYAAGNRVKARQFAIDEAAEDAKLRRTRVAFDQRFATRVAAAVDDPRVPVFVVGMPRSGTTLIEQILASHPAVHGAGEIPDLADVLQARLGPAEHWPEAGAKLAAADWRGLGQTYLDRVWQRAPQATHIVNKTTSNYRCIGPILAMFPQARILHAVRDPLDACLSCYTHLFEGDSLPYTYDLGTLGRYYVRYATYMSLWHGAMPDAVLDVRYENLVADIAAQTRRMLDWLGLPWDAGCLEFYRNRRVVATASRAEVRRPIYHDSIGRWRRFEPNLQPLLELVRAVGRLQEE